MKTILVALLLVLALVIGGRAAPALQMPEKDAFPFQFHYVDGECNGGNWIIIGLKKDSKTPYFDVMLLYFLDDSPKELKPWMAFIRAGDGKPPVLYVDWNRDGLADEITVDVDKFIEKYGETFCENAEFLK